MTTSTKISIDGFRVVTCDVDDECMMVDIDHSQVQPDVEELTPNIEDNEDAESRKSEAPNLGKLEYSIDYDFQKQEVSM
jgi:hypothetical protein